MEKTIVQLKELISSFNMKSLVGTPYSKLKKDELVAYINLWLSRTNENEKSRFYQQLHGHTPSVTTIDALDRLLQSVNLETEVKATATYQQTERRIEGENVTVRRQCIKVGELRKIGIHSLVEWKMNPKHFYCGRYNRNVAGADASLLGNPYTLKKEGSNCIVLYEQHLRSRPDLLQLIASYPRDAVFGCWCESGEQCHTDIICKLYREIVG